MAHAIKKLIHTVFQQQDSWKIELLKTWPTILGDLGQKVHLEKIEQDSVTLGITDACWLQELYMLSPLIKQAINQKLDAPRIKTVRFKRISKINKRPKKMVSKHIWQANKRVILSEAQHKTLKRIKDIELQKAIENFLGRCQQEQNE